MAIVLQEGLRAVFYAPFYAALALGAYAAEGIAARLVSSPSPGQTPDGLFAGTVDVSWGGPMRVNEIYDRRPDCDLVCFGEAVTRDPFMLIGRTPCPDFRPAMLERVRLGTVSEVPTPWLCLQEDLRRAGIDPEKIDRVSDRSMAENADSLRRGEIDVVQLFQPFAEELLAAGAGHLWYAAADRGPCSYTTFYARRAALEAKRDEMRRLVRGLYRTQRWLAGATPERVAEVVAPYFPAVPQPLLTAALARYRELGIWNRTPVLPRDGYERLKAGLVSSGFAKGVPYETAVDNSLAEEAVAADPPPLSPG